LEACMALDKEQYLEAEALAWGVMNEQADSCGPYHPETLKATWLLGRTMMWQGRYSASLEYLERAREGYLSIYGPIHPDTLECQVDWAVALAAPPACPHAKTLMAFASEQLQLILGEEHPSSLHARVHLDLLLLEEQSDGVEERFERSLIICRAILGEEHDLTRLCMETLEEIPVRD